MPPRFAVRARRERFNRIGDGMRGRATVGSPAACGDAGQGPCCEAIGGGMPSLAIIFEIVKIYSLK